MTLPPGTRLGPYEVVSQLGAGGMGEVYRARDSKLGRDVAIKVLPEAVAQDVELLARFEREAKTLAALNHPNIAHIHGLEERPPASPGLAGMRALVMELVEGEDLSARIGRGPIAPADAVPIAMQIAEALETAHGQGIIHRDLKPANVKVRGDGTVKVLDFGLAKAVDPAGTAETGDTANSPTFAGATQRGMILGTAAYMAPEQARGKPVDKRADVWAFGAVLFEMLTGTRAFPGEDLTDTLAAVVRTEPNWTLLPPGLPPTLVVYLKRCLQKDPKQRIPDIATMRLALAGALDTAATPLTSLTHRPSRHPLVLASIAIAALSLAAAAFAVWNRPAPIQGPAARLTIPLPARAEITSYPAITRDGRTVAYVAQLGTEDAQLYLRDLNSFEVRAVPGASGARMPFFSPDGTWVGFIANGYLQKAEVAGGTPIRLAEAAYGYGGTWTEENTIIYAASLGSGLLQIPDAGGPPTALTTPDGAARGYAHVFPQSLPGVGRVLFTVWGRNKGSAMLSLASGQWDLVLPSTTFASATFDKPEGTPGRLLVVEEAGGIRGAPFDPARPASTSLGGAVLDGVYYETETQTMGWLAVSNTGTAVYAAGNPGKTSLVWVSRDGKVESAGRKQDVYREVSISPDGTRAVVRRATHLWIHDFQRSTSSPLTSGEHNNILPVWSRDGRRVVFASNRDGDWDIYSQPADGSRPAEVLLKRPSDQFPYSFSSEGTLLYTEIAPKTGRDLWTLSPDGKPSPLRVTQFNEYVAEFSPAPAAGSRWIAYASDESGRSEIYVQLYPGGEQRTAVSAGGGMRPMWSPDGKELFFVTGDAVVSVAMQPNGTFGAPRRLADRSSFFLDDRFHSYSVSPAGDRILMIRRDPGSVPNQLNVILDWFSDPRRD